MIGTMPNLHRAALRSCHTFDLPPMCPVSGNPQPGSVIEVWYTPDRLFLEVETLAAYIASYIGGRSVGGVFIRDMEQTIQQIAQDCADAIRVEVAVVARLNIGTQQMRLIVKARPL